MNIDKQALREAAEKATRGPWEMEQENIWFTDTDGYVKHLIYVQQGDDVDDKQDHYNTAFIAAFNPKVALALLDENLQLQREKDAIEAVALALRDDMRQAREQLKVAEKRIAEQREYYEGVIADGSKRIAELEAREIKPSKGEVLVTVSGFTGCGKSAIAGEIEIAMKAIGVPVQWTNGDAEKRMMGADWLTAIEMYRPTVRIVEVNVPRAAGIKVKES
ncbi:ead/Ea22-like family protein [Salmonella enterica]|nr:ead/Ea22-like family protein [Salmonella enterica]EIB1173772.1 ead/Ea22-like family protein [Salmonella enterica]